MSKLILLRATKRTVPEPKGTVLERSGRLYAQVTVAKNRKQAFRLGTLARDEAHRRAVAIAEIVRKLREAGREGLVLRTAKNAARASAELFEEIQREVDLVILTGEETNAGFVPSKKPTFRELGEAWTTGKLHRTYPDHIPLKSTATDDGWRLEKHVYPLVENVALTNFTLDDAQEVLRNLSPKLSSASRRHIAQLMARVLKLAAYPCRIIPRSPIPVGFLPRIRGEKALEYLYPDEDAKLLGCKNIPLVYRMLYGILAREGMRSGELARLTFADLDLERGAVKLDENKTDDPRAWALNPSVVDALKLWRKHFRADADDNAFVLVEPDIRKHPAPRRVNVDRSAVRFRRHLKKAEVDRPALFENTATRRQIRIHDLRATFVTLSLAHGRTEAWIADRTGHRSSIMINRYRRAARKVEELGLGELAPLDEAIPELAALKPKPQPAPQPGSDGGGERKQRTSKTSGKVRRSYVRKRRFASLGSGAARREGSTPSSCTKGLEIKVETVPERGTRRGAQVASKSVPGCVASPNPANPRAGVVADLSARLAELVAAGDLEGARAVSDAIASLLGTGDARGGVLDLEKERYRRGKV